jgi:hypothetical protein
MDSIDTSVSSPFDKTLEFEAAEESYFDDLDALAPASTQKSHVTGWSMVDTIESMAFAQPTAVEAGHPEKKRSTVESLGSLMIAPNAARCAGNTAASGLAVEGLQKNASVSYKTAKVPPSDEASDSYVEMAVDEICDWASWVWSTINPWNSADGTNHHDGLMDIGKTNPFSNTRQSLSPAERARFREQVAEMNLLFDKLRELLEDDQFEKVMQLILQASVNSRKEAMDFEQAKMIETYQKKMGINKERLEEANKLIDASKRSQWWGQFEEVASTLGLGLAATMTMGTGGWGVVALCYSAGASYNRFFTDHAFEKKVSSGISWLGVSLGLSSKTIEGNLENTLKIGSGIVHGLLMFSLGGVQQWLGTLLQGTMQIVNVQVKTKSDRAQGRLYEIDEKLKEKQGGVTGHVKKLGKQYDAKTKDQKIAAEVTRRNGEMTQEILRGA